MAEKVKLMSHLVAGFPSDDMAFTAAKAMVAGGTDVLLVQLPFSDPSADGPAIQSACTETLSRGYRTADGLKFIERLHREFPDVPVYVMSYGSLVFTPGVKEFCKKAAAAGVKGMVVPDFPFDNDEGLIQACKENGMENIPVAAPGMDPERLKKMAHGGYKYIYAALRAGISGSEVCVEPAVQDFLNRITEGGSLVYGRFGINSGVQAAALAHYVHAVIAGSVFVRLIKENEGNAEKTFAAVEAKTRELTCCL